MALRDPHYLELVQRERLDEAATEREASVAARDGWLPDSGPIEEPEPSIRRDIFRAVLRAGAHGAFAAGLIMEGGWVRWVGAVVTAFVVAWTLGSARRIGRQLIERREPRVDSIGI